MALYELTWDSKGHVLEPKWAFEPEIEPIWRQIQTLRPTQQVKLAFSNRDSFNKVYNVTIGSEPFIMRVLLPVDPTSKTVSEIATIEWVRLNTQLPVPTIIGHREVRYNPFDFEWILTSKLPGVPLAFKWWSLPWARKEELVQKLAAFAAATFQHKFRGIGNIYPVSATTPQPEENECNVQRIVSKLFFQANHLHQNAARGPFRSSRDWINSRMAFHRNDCNNWIAEYKTREDTNSSDDTSLDIAQKALGILDTFRYLMERVIPENGNFPEPSMLFHNNLSIYNIMVSEDGELTGVVNWECVSALPLWKACEFPSFLNCPTRYEAPDPTQHNLDGTDLVYWERLMEYEVTKLRFYFLNEMRRMEPRWVEVYEASQPRRDLDNAIQVWDNAILPMDFRTWMEGVTSGDAMIVPLPPQED